jgi:hypothetical protein
MSSLGGFTRPLFGFHPGHLAIGVRALARGVVGLDQRM